MSLPDLIQSVDDLKGHSERLETTRARRAELLAELKVLQVAEEQAVSAVETTQKLVAELANSVARGGK